MSYCKPGPDGPEEPVCRYGASKLLFRGPRRALDAPYVACIGGTDTFGRFVENPFPAVLDDRLGMTCVNLGSVSCGLEAMAQDPELMHMAQEAERCVIQLTGAHNLSNRLYRVHPRRNDRFLEPSEFLTRLYPEVDFTEFHFTRHLLAHLLALSDERFTEVCEELRRAWIDRMHHLLAGLEHPAVLLWLQYEGPLAEEQGGDLGPEPFLVDAGMVAALQDLCAVAIEIPVRASGDSDELGDMLFGTMQQPVAEHMIGPVTHHAIAERICKTLLDLD
ncbi:DUF6473 family protein [Ruegeria sp. HKCCD8929]|uniref:DUF6473 family protein n=1 Tax=Ruegeria sp. HKCCD8929 TaxID=2683006 RepID=UPI0020C519D8|nr:DUF6473 family protein [Ruegeria sp. HKCCD8929]